MTLFKSASLKGFCLFISMPFSRQWLACEVLFYLVFSKCLIGVLPFRLLAKTLGFKKTETPLEALCLNRKQQLRLRAFSQLLPKISALLPWRSVCLHQAVAASFLVRRMYLPSTFYFGIQHLSAASIEAHAWLRCGDVYVVGGRGDGCQVIATYAQWPGPSKRLKGRLTEG